MVSIFMLAKFKMLKDIIAIEVEIMAIESVLEYYLANGLTPTISPSTTLLFTILLHLGEPHLKSTLTYHTNLNHGTINLTNTTQGLKYIAGS